MPNVAPPPPRRRGRLIAAAAATLSLLAPAAAHAGWYVPPPVAAKATASYPSVSVDRAGNATLVWVEGRFDVPAASVHLQRTFADGSTGPAQRLGDTLPMSPVRTATAPGGATVVAWMAAAPVPGQMALNVASVAADGAAGPVRTVFSGEDFDVDWDVAVDDAGAAVATWIARDPDGAAIQVMARRIAADGTPGPLVRIDGPGAADARPQVAMTPAGTAFLAYRLGPPAAPAAWVARLDATGELDGAPVAVSTGGIAASGPGLAASANGAAVVWDETAGVDTSHVRLARLRASGAPVAATHEVSAGAIELDGLATVALSPGGIAQVAYARDTPSGTPSTVVEIRRFAADGAAGPVQQVSSSSSLTVQSLAPSVGAGDDGSFVVSWLDATMATGYAVAAASIAPDGTIGAPARVAPVAPLFPAGGEISSLAVDGVGGAALAWMQIEELTMPLPLISTATAVYDAAPPQLEVTAPATVALGGDAVLAVAARDRTGVKEVWWEFGDDSGSRRATTRHRYADPGTYPVTVTVTDNAGNSTTATRQVTVAAPPPLPTRVPAALRVGRVARKGAKVTVTGTLDRRASGTVTVAYSQRIGRRSHAKRATATIARGRFSATLRLTGALAKARGGKATVKVSYAGDDDTNLASASKTVAVPKAKPKKPKQGKRGGRRR